MERSNLRRDGSLVQEGLSEFDKDIRQLLNFSSGLPPIFFNVRFPENSIFINANHEPDEDDVQNCESFAYDWIKSEQLQTSCSMRVRIRACSDCGLMDFKVSS